MVETGGRSPHAKVCLELPEAGTGKEGSSPPAFRGSLASRTVREDICIVLSHLVCGALSPWRRYPNALFLATSRYISRKRERTDELGKAHRLCEDL